MENNTIDTMYEAICAGDEETLAQCLERATIETVLQFEACKKKSPLHLCLDIPNGNRFALIRLLIASGLVDATQHDSDGFTVLVRAYETGDLKLVEQLIVLETDGVDGPTACYRLMRHGSLKLFQKYLMLRNEASEADTFQSIASALVKLNVKNLDLPKDLRFFLHWKLSDYAYRNLVGDWPGAKDPQEWMGQMEIFFDCWSAIRKRYNTHMFDDIDNQLLHRLQVIHNHLYFLKNFPFLNHLPLTEVVFCLAIFIFGFKKNNFYEAFRLLINKCLIMEFLGMIDRQLVLARGCIEEVSRELKEIMAESLNRRATKASIADSKQPKSPEVGKMKLKEEIYTRLPYMVFPENVANKLLADVKKGKSSDLAVAEVIAGEVIDLKHLVRGKDRAIIRRVKKCYAKTKQLFSLMKIIYYWEQMYSLERNDRTVFTDSFKRILQVMGESVKNTQNSPNMPGKVLTTLNSMMSESFSTFNMLLRETFSHSMTLARTLMSEEIEWRVFTMVRQHSYILQAMFNLLLTVFVEDARLTMYGMMLRCRSLEQLRSFLVYVGKMEKLDEIQQGCYQKVKNYFDTIKNILNDTDELPVRTTTQFLQIKTLFDEQYKLVADLEAIFEIHADVGFAKVREASFASKDLRTVRRLLDWILTLRTPLKFFDRIRALWQLNFEELHYILPNDVRLVLLDASRVTLLLINYLESIKAAEELDYLQHTRELAQKLGVAVEKDKGKVQQLHKMLKKYYRNIFAIDLKRKILEDFLEVKKSNKEVQDGKEAVIDHQEDQKRLQTLFDERRSRLQAILIQNRMDSVESLHDWNPSNPGIIAAIEYLTLELTEMLTSVGYFGNSFYYVMHRIPMIQGKNYRNYLAHDSISYSILSGTHQMEIIVLNAYVIANTAIRLFDRRVKPFGEVMRFPSVEDTHRWVAEQDRLMAAFQSQDVGMMHAAIRAGGELRSLFCCSPYHHYPSEYRPMTVLYDPCHPGPWIKELLSRYYNTFSEKINDPYIVLDAFMRRDYEKAFPRMLQLNSFHLAIFKWNEFISHLRGTELFKRIISEKFRHHALRLLIKNGNERSVREMLHFFPGDIRSDETLDPLNDAILWGVWSIVELLLAKVSSPHPQSLQSAIITHAPKEIFNTLLGKHCICASCFNNMISTSIRAKNQVVFGLLLEHPTLLQHRSHALGECHELAAITPGQHKILQQLLENYPPANPTGLARILHEAARRQHWKYVRMLLEAGVSTDVVHHIPMVEGTTFLLLVRHGQTRLLERVKAVDRVMYGSTTVHPLALAVRYGHDNKRMVRVLKRLGFGWFDRSTVLHHKLLCCRMQSLEQTWTDLDEDKLKRSSTVIDKEDYFSVALTALPHWKTIAYVEQVVSGRTALFSALQYNPERSRRNAKDSEVIKILKERLKYLSCLAHVESNADEIDQLKASTTRMEKRVQEKLEHFTESLQKRSQNSRMGRRINDQLEFATERLKEQPYLEGRDLHKRKENVAEFVKRLQNRKETGLNELLCPEYTTSKKQEIDQLKKFLRKLERCEAQQRYDLVSTLLDRSQKSRIIEGLGVLSDIVFENDSKIVRLDKEDENQTLYVHTCCENMITRMEILLTLKNCDFWREVTVNLGVSVTFRVLCIADEENEFPPSFEGVCKIPAAATLLDTFIKLRDMCKAVFRSYDVICAHVVTTEAMIYYWQIEELSCAFDVRPPGTTFDLANIINTRDFTGTTALHYCLAYPSSTKPQESVFQHWLAKLLLDHGANPLLADNNNAVALNWTLLYSAHPAIAHDAIEKCLQCNELGKPILNLTPRMQVDLINDAVLQGRSDVVERLIELGVNVKVLGKYGTTPAHCAVLVPLHTSYRMLKMLLDYDRSLLYMKDAAGNTILHSAAEVESAELMDLIRSYDPNLPVIPMGPTTHTVATAPN